MSHSLTVLVGIPCRWVTPTDVSKRLMHWLGDSKHNVVPVYESGASRLDMSLSKLILFAKQQHPDLFLRLDDDILPLTPLDDIVSHAAEDFSRGFQMVFGPTRAATGTIMVKLSEDSNVGNELPQPRTCVPAYYGALCFSVMSPKLVEAYQPHLMETTPGSFLNGHGRFETRLYCTRWDQVGELPPIPTLTRRIYASVPALDDKEGVPLYVYNPPDTSEDVDMCRDIHINDMGLGCDSRFKHLHHKATYVPSYGQDPQDEVVYAEQHPEWKYSEEVLSRAKEEANA